MKKKTAYILIPDITLKGGLERFVANLSSSLSSDLKVYVVSFHKTNELPLYEFEKNVEIIYLTKIRFGRLYKLTTLYSCVKFYFINSGDAWIIGVSPIINIILSILFSDLSNRMIASEHSSYYSHGRFVRLLRTIQYKKLLGIVTQTDDGLNAFIKHGINAIKIRNSVTDFHCNEQWQARGVLSSIDNVKFLSIARFEEVKQLNHIIEIAKLCIKKFPTWCFNIVGDGVLKEDLISLISTNNLEGYVNIVPPTPHVARYYMDASFYLLTSSSEAFPMVMIEAMSFGVPVISYDGLAGPKDFLVDSQNGYLIEQDNFTAMAEKIIKLASLGFDDYHRVSLDGVESARTLSEKNIRKKWLQFLGE